MSGRIESDEPDLATGAQAGSGQSPPALMRKIAAAIVAALAVVTLLAATVGVWAHRTLLDTDTYVETVAPLARDPAFIEAVATRLTVEVVDLLEIERRVSEALPREYSLLSIPITEAARSQLKQLLIRAMETEQFAKVWESANRLAHQTVVAILRNEARYLDTAGGEVKVDLVLLGADVIRELGKRIAFVGDRLSVPRIDSDTSPAEVRRILGESIGRPIPEDFGQVTIFRSDQLESAQRAVSAFDQVVVALVILTAILYLGAIAISTRRLRMLSILGISAVLASVVAQAVLRDLQSSVAESIADPELRTAVVAGVSAFVGSLDTYVELVLIGGILAITVAFLASANSVAVAARIRVAGVFGKVSDGGLDFSNSESRALKWIAANKSYLQIAGVAIVVVAALVFRPSAIVLLILLLILGIYEFVLALIDAATEGNRNGSS
ncbi:MAG: hypothetical protein DCC49_05580 [Acidobacteria bacterium]|nr:MAG: hypothetical protein DCC49_05580 [Acidobacteriota bacterium]